MQLLLLSHHIIDVCEKMNGCQKDVDHDRRILLIREQVKHLKKQFLILQHSMHWLNHRDKNFKYYFLQSSTRDLLNKLISLTYYFFTNAQPKTSMWNKRNFIHSEFHSWCICASEKQIVLNANVFYIYTTCVSTVYQPIGNFIMSFLLSIKINILLTLLVCVCVCIHNTRNKTLINQIILCV